MIDIIKKILWGMNNSLCLILLFTIAVPLTGCINDTPEEGRSLILTGESIPEFEILMNDGRVVSDKTLKGKVAVIMFFTTNCRDCREALPIVQQAYDSDWGAEFICIARNEAEPEIAKYWSTNCLSLPYSPQENSDVYHLFATSGVPRLYIVNRVGKITAQYDDYNFPDKVRLQAAISDAVEYSIQVE